MLTAWIAANVYAYVHGHAIHAVNDPKNGRRARGPTTHRGWHDPRNQLLQCFEFHDKHGRNRRKERICFDHELVRDQNKCVLFAAIASVLVMKFKALEQLISRKKSYPGLKAYCYMITILLE